MTRSRRRVWAFRIAAVLISSVLSLLFAEVVVRLVDGYRLDRLRLERTSEHRQWQESADSALYGIEQFLAEFDFSPEVDPRWIHERPPPLARQSVPPELQRRAERGGYKSNFVYNERYLRRYLPDWPGPLDHLTKQAPFDVFVFPAPWGSEEPPYRYLPDATLTTGLVTNSFGWRGPSISVEKPARTIRIASLGSSTTVSFHSMPFSYPELLVRWLELWAAERGYDDIRFEVINAAREGINSRSIAAILEYEVLPLRPDFVIYYEGSNQFNVSSVVRVGSMWRLAAAMPEALVGSSALLRRIRALGYKPGAGDEPRKPRAEFRLPDGVDEEDPRLEHLGVALNLGQILSDLDQIEGDTRASGSRLLLSTFKWCVFDGMALDPVRQGHYFDYLNRIFWPFSYRDMRRAADFQNRVFRGWARQRAVPLLDVAGRMPDRPDLFTDPIHNTYEGVVIRGWIVFEELLPLVREEIESGRLPAPFEPGEAEHPHILPPRTQRIAAGRPPRLEAAGASIDLAPIASPRQEPERVPAAAELYALALVPAAANWAAGTGGTSIEPAGPGLEVVSDRSTFSYQLVSDEIVVTPGAQYEVVFDVQVSAGRMALGVLDVDADRWIVSKHLPTESAGDTRLAFTPGGARIQVVLMNANDPEGVSRARSRGSSSGAPPPRADRPERAPEAAPS